MSESNGIVDQCRDGTEDMEMEDGSVESEAGDRSKEGGDEGVSELRGRRLARARDKAFSLGLGREDGMVI